jgi:hypothetical protein
MPRPKSSHAATNAERQAAYRARKKAEGLKRIDRWADPTVNPRGTLSREQEELKRQWQNELQEEQVKAVRKAGRKKEQHKYYQRGYVTAVVSICGFFIKNDRVDIAQALLSEYSIDQTVINENQVNSLSTAILVKAGLLPGQ